ncbi:hypothetical protein [Alkalihalobacillus sp. LMS39]|uniref:hypothetical protein n=1 Tax=Alkalihalobacillus sp. LMS39 TaxID=2924032 RepID=UPI001FB3566D|nr:hypothetical protein [Alkalihalobacillus sp. LMS39]UOE92595.1 hypothetical protein MM271_15285 [Alkalihalobacillus sp. LMS39]
MLGEITNELLQAKEKVWLKRKWSEHITRAEKELKHQEEKMNKLKSLMEKEAYDVQRLEGMSLYTIFYSLIGKKEEKLAEEKEQVIKATLAYDEARETVEDIKEEIQEWTALLNTVSDADERYHVLLLEKEKLMKQGDSNWEAQLLEMAEHEADLKGAIQEYKDAILAGKKAVQSLDLAIDFLEKAKGWSTWDMVGGGLLTTAIKHDHLDSAKKSIHTAQKKLRHFYEELLDVKHHVNAQIELGSFLSFADFFFDGLFIDWMVHGKIQESLDQILKAKQETSSVLKTVKQECKQLEQNRVVFEKEKVAFIEKAGS